MSGSHELCRQEGHHICQELSGRVCDEPGCEQAAGTWWGPYWCPEHDQERLDRISAQLKALIEEWPEASG